MKFVLLVIIVMQLFTCTLTKNANQINDKQLIVGIWRSIDKASKYPSINFSSDSLASVGSTIDTVFWFRYQIKKNHLFLKSGYKDSRNRILKLDQDSLTFYSFLDVNRKQSYYRKR